LPSVRFIDFDISAFLEEVTAVGSLTHGAYSYKDCYDMQFDDYEKIVKIIEKLIKEKKGNAGR